MRAILFGLLFYNFSLQAQGVLVENESLLELTNHEPQQIETTKLLYFFAEIHVDNLSSFYNEKTVEPAKIISKRLYDSLYYYLYTNCNVKSFFFEAPGSYQYFFHQYIVTGDSMWLSIIDSYELVKYQLKILRNIYLIDSTLNIHCIDRESDSNIDQLVNTLFYLFFYEPYKPDEKNGIAANNSESFRYFDSSYRSSAIYKHPSYNILKFVRDLKYLPKKKDAKDLYNEFLRIDTNHLLLLEYKNLLGNNFEYFMDLKSSYVNFYGNKGKTGDEFEAREEFMATKITNLISKNLNISYFGQFGSSHAVPNNFISQPLLNKLYDKFEYENCIYSALLYFPQFKSMYPINLFNLRDSEFLHNQYSKKWTTYKTTGIPTHVVLLNTYSR